MDLRSTRYPTLGRRTALAGIAQAVVLLAAACTAPRRSAEPVAPASPAPAAAATSTPAPAPTGTPAPTPTSEGGPIALPTEGPGCAGRLAQVIAPTPIPYPGYTEVEPSTGLHVTAPPRSLDVATYRLKVTGKVQNWLSLTYDELRCLPKISAYTQIACPGFFIDWSHLAGASLAAVLEMASPLEDAKEVGFTGDDGRRSTVLLADARAAQYFLAYEWEGQPLPASHGFPVRAALLNTIGGGWVKWLTEIDVM